MPKTIRSHRTLSDIEHPCKIGVAVSGKASTKAWLQVHHGRGHILQAEGPKYNPWPLQLKVLSCQLLGTTLTWTAAASQE